MVLLDVRTPQEYASGYIPQAINLDVNNPNFAEQIQKLDPNKTYIVYCRTGNRSLLASQQMQAIGLKTIYVEQGFSYWQQAGYPIETSN
jgi:rhodanese-related sulfurtransferase